MAGYRKPKNRLHREFLYLNHETIMNSLSAVEAGKIDEILEKVSDTKEGGFDGSAGWGPVKAGANKKKAANIQEELVRKRTQFSAFDAWFKYLDEQDALGELTGWDLETRSELEVGDTVRFNAGVSIGPLHQVFSTFLAFANEASNPNSPFKQPAAQVAGIRKQATMISSWMRGKSDNKSILTHFAPLGMADPKIVARLDEDYLVGGAQALEGEYTVIAQVETLIAEDDIVPVIRVIRDVPPTSLEVDTITKGFQGFIEPAAKLGVTITDDDLTLGYPAVVVHPIAIYR